jgi:hypothetical protein
VYYDFAARQWREDGCFGDTSLLETGVMLCTCHHLTNFAVLLDHQGNTGGLSTDDRLALGYITVIGCSISIILLGILVLVFIFYKVLLIFMCAHFS